MSESVVYEKQYVKKIPPDDLLLLHTLLSHEATDLWMAVKWRNW